jgi:hypothetical protein
MAKPPHAMPNWPSGALFIMHAAIKVHPNHTGPSSGVQSRPSTNPSETSRHRALLRPTTPRALWFHQRSSGLPPASGQCVERRHQPCLVPHSSFGRRRHDVRVAAGAIDEAATKSCATSLVAMPKLCHVLPILSATAAKR